MSVDAAQEQVQAREDELDLIACCLSGWPAHDVDIRADEFHDIQAEAAWRAIQKLADAGKEVNPSSVRVAIGNDKAGVWLIDVFGRPVAAADANIYAARIRKASQARRLQRLAISINSQLANHADPLTVLGELQDFVRDHSGATTKGVETIGDALPRVLDQVEQGTKAGKSSPWPDLDRRINGLGEGQLIIVAARPGVGKSLIGQNIAWHFAARHNLPTYFASLEMSIDELTTRTVSQVAGVTQDTLNRGGMSERDWGLVEKATPKLMEAPIYVNDRPQQTIDDIRAGARALQQRRGLGVVVVDYMQLVTPRDRKMPREQQVAEISRGLKIMAKELHVPVVAMSQVRRLAPGEKNREPSLHDLRESGSIEQDADAVLILHIPDEEDPFSATLAVAKSRHGQRGRVPLVMATHYARVLNEERVAA